MSDQGARQPVTIREDWCKGCNICVSVCPKGVLAKSRKAPAVAKPEECITCRLCEISCPDYAISVKKLEAKEAKA